MFSRMPSEQKADEGPTGELVLDTRPGAISPSQTQDVHDDAEDACEANLLVNDDKAEGFNTVRDASSDLIPPSQEENSKVGGSHEDGEASQPSNQKKKVVFTAES